MAMLDYQKVNLASPSPKIDYYIKVGVRFSFRNTTFCFIVVYPLPAVNQKWEGCSMVCFSSPWCMAAFWGTSETRMSVGILVPEAASFLSWPHRLGHQHGQSHPIFLGLHVCRAGWEAFSCHPTISRFFVLATGDSKSVVTHIYTYVIIYYIYGAFTCFHICKWRTRW